MARAASPTLIYAWSYSARGRQRVRGYNTRTHVLAGAAPDARVSRLASDRAPARTVLSHSPCAHPCSSAARAPPVTTGRAGPHLHPSTHLMPSRLHLLAADSHPAQPRCMRCFHAAQPRPHPTHTPPASPSATALPPQLIPFARSFRARRSRHPTQTLLTPPTDITPASQSPPFHPQPLHETTHTFTSRHAAEHRHTAPRELRRGSSALASSHLLVCSHGPFVRARGAPPRARVPSCAHGRAAHVQSGHARAATKGGALNSDYRGLPRDGPLCTAERNSEVTKI